jgi:hypothetical protein
MNTTAAMALDGADLSEARRLHAAGLVLCKLLPFKKQPEGEGWNVTAVRSIEPGATGYGVLLARNGLCSIDPDRVDQSRQIMRALGFDLETLMEAGARSKSTRPGSGGRSVFADPGGLAWLRFSFDGLGTVLELRAQSANLQDAVPGLLYSDKTGEIRTQTAANERRIDDRCPLPEDLVAWWRRCSTDLDFLREQQRIAGEAIGARPLRAVSAGGGTLAYPSPLRADFNACHDIEQMLLGHGYSKHGKRLKAPNSEGGPGVRRIPGKEGLWQSDHASDPLFGTFDAWTVFVVLDHLENIAAAEAAFEPELHAFRAGDFDDEHAKARDDALALIEAADLVGMEPEDLARGVAERMQSVALADSTTREILDRVSARSAQAAEQVRALLGMAGSGPGGSNIVGIEEFLAKMQPPDYVWHRVLQKGCLYAFTAKWGHGKTAVMNTVAMHVAAGRALAGHQITQTRVLYLCGENPADVQLRASAAAMRFGIDLDELRGQLYFTRRPFAIDSPAELKKFVREASVHGPFGLVVIDTGPAHSSSEEENDNREMHKLAMAMRDLMTPLGNPATVALMHPTKEATRENLQPRGGGAFSGSIDGELCGWADQGVVEFFHRTKFRGPGFDPISFHLERVELPGMVDNFGEPVVTVVAVEAAGDGAAVARAQPLKGSAEIARRALDAALGDIALMQTLDRSMADEAAQALYCQPPAVVIHIDDWRRMAYDMGISDGDADARKKAFRRARDKLVEMGVVRHWKDWVWLKATARA